MSKRAIKRLEEQHLGIPEFIDGESSDVNDITDNTSPSIENRQSVFALLRDEDNGDGSEDEQIEDEDLAISEHLSHTTLGPQASSAIVETGSVENQNGEPDISIKSKNSAEPNAQSTKPKMSKKKKKKKRKDAKRSKQPTDPENDPDWIALNAFHDEANDKSRHQPSGFIPRSYFTTEDDDDVRNEAKRIMALIERMAFSDGAVEQHVQGNPRPCNSALIVKPRLLNADTELKRLFGGRVIESERRAEEANAARAGRRQRAGGRAHLRRKVSLVTPRDTWFDQAPGLIMDLDSEATNNASERGISDVKYFRYAHEAHYARLQDLYLELVKSHDPNLLVDICSRYPYHVDSLLQLAELYRQMGELDRAAEQVERCLYVLEGSWHVSFKPFDGTCRLSFDVMENRPLYVALFRYSQLLTRRGLYRTSLEISKLLLNLDPENDPMGMLMLADSYALLSIEYQWIEDMRETYEYIPIKYFPNFAASAALAKDAIRSSFSETGNRSGSSSMAKNGKNSEEMDAENDSAKAKEVEDMLIDTILTFPMIVMPLLNATDNSSTVWTEHRLFEEPWYAAGYTDGGLLNRMARVYAERSKLLWSSERNKVLLVQCAQKAGQLDSMAGMGIDPKTGRMTSAFVSDEQVHERVARCRAFRVEAANWLVSSGLYRNVQIDDFGDSATNLPAELLTDDDVELLTGLTRQREVTVGRGALEFLQSLLPWREARDARGDDDA